MSLYSQRDAVGWSYNTIAVWAVIELGRRFELTNAIARLWYSFLVVGMLRSVSSKPIDEED